MSVNIVIIEDEAIIAQDIELMLKNLGYTVTQMLNNSTNAIDYLSFHTPDLVLCDINIKGPLDGIEVAKQIGIKKKIPFVYLTSLADKETILRASQTAPYGYIIKPFDQNDLHSAIEIAIAKYQMELDALLITNEKLNQIAACEITEKEHSIISLMIKGKTYPEITEELNISQNTVKYHTKNIFFKFEAANRSGLMQKILSKFTKI